MKTQIIIQSVFVLALTGLLTLPAAAAPTLELITGGDFEDFALGSPSPLGQPGNSWMIQSDPAGQPFGITLFDMDGVGLLGESQAFMTQVGGTTGGTLTIMQTVTLLEGIEYNFSADLASGTPASNIDGGRVTASIVSLGILDQHDFGILLYDQPEFATLQGTFTPGTSGDYLLSIAFGRNYQQNLNTPILYLDNVSLTSQVVPAPGALLLSSIGLFCVRWLRSRRAIL